MLLFEAVFYYNKGITGFYWSGHITIEGMPADHKARRLWASLQQSMFTCENQRNLGQMNVLANNCVSKISVPKGANSGNGVAYNPVLGLFVTIDFYKGISVWDPVKGKEMAKRNVGEDVQLDVLILHRLYSSVLPGNRIAVSYSEGNHGGFLGIYSLQKGKMSFKAPELYLISSGLSPSGWTLDPGALSFSPQRNLLVAGSMVGNGDVRELCMDWENLKVLETREIFLSGHKDCICKMQMLYCSVDSVILTREFDSEEGEYAYITIPIKTKEKQKLPEIKN